MPIMLKIKLGEVSNRFDGRLTKTAYLVLGKLILKHGPLASIEIPLSNDADEQTDNVHKAIVKADRNPSGIICES